MIVRYYNHAMQFVIIMETHKSFLTEQLKRFDFRNADPIVTMADYKNAKSSFSAIAFVTLQSL